MFIYHKIFQNYITLQTKENIIEYKIKFPNGKNFKGTVSNNDNINRNIFEDFMQTEIDNNLTLIELVLFGANLAITPSDLDYFSSKFRSPKKHYISENFFDKKISNEVKNTLITILIKVADTFGYISNQMSILKELKFLVLEKRPDLYPVFFNKKYLESTNIFYRYKKTTSNIEKNYIKNIIENSNYLKKDLANPLIHEKLKDLEFLEYQVTVTGYISEEYEGACLREITETYIADQEIPSELLFNKIEENYDFENIIDQEISGPNIVKKVSNNAIFLEIIDNKIITGPSYYRFKGKDKDWKLKKLKTEAEKLIEKLKRENLVLEFNNIYLYYNAGNFMLMDKSISNEQALDLVESEDFEISNLKKVKVNGVVVLGEIL